MAWNCCCSSPFPATTSAVVVPAIYAAARAPNSFTITLRKHNAPSIRNLRNRSVSPNSRARSKATEPELKIDSSPSDEIDCIGTGLDVECVINPTDDLSEKYEQVRGETRETTSGLVELAGTALEWGLLISPFFFWGTAMVAMKEVLPKTGPFVVAAFRLIPAGFLLVGFAASRGRRFPSGLNAWLSISAFAAIDASCFQGFLAEGLERTTAGLGSVIIDSQPLTVAILASLLFGESIGYIGAAGLVLGVIGLLLLEVPALAYDANNFSLWGSGEWWMFLAAQSMAIGTVMVRWVSKYSDPVMATGWHMVIGGLPLMAIAILNHEPALSSFHELTTSDALALLYTSIFGSAISYGVYFYNATRGSLTKLSSLTFLTPMFASLFGFAYLGETFTPFQLVGALVTIAAIYMVNYKNEAE
ncbi:nodulin MtN21 /EamA-like transporter family protein [Perilla frutescens var. hirtella]|uniref:Nodulin MtN21 /EamA-like transporter family protein n=1 Tax=Perilla frutescens var. hirtella TaxID=608512 RepID=A0AAD4PFZ0_PERFH|nr:nodulin MtN21 /EamA-like transporter family protein [Perilla frutescens var. hirtella]